MCPVHQWAAIIWHVSSYPGGTISVFPITNTILNNIGRLTTLKSKVFLNKLWVATTATVLMSWVSLQMRLASTVCAVAPQEPCISLASPFTQLCWLPGGWVMPFENKYKNSVLVLVRRCWVEKFFTILEVQHKDPWVSRHCHNFAARNKSGCDASSHIVGLAHFLSPCHCKGSTPLWLFASQTAVSRTSSGMPLGLGFGVVLEVI